MNTNPDNDDQWFGDAEPEDSWDPDDPVVDLLRNIIRRVLLLAVLHGLAERDALRVAQIREDLEHILARVREGRL